MEHVDTIVAGAGIVGLAIARRLALAGREVIVLEKESAIGTGISSRNSEVLHAGLYYPPGSLKARACVEGNRMLTRYCLERGIGMKKCGKLVVGSGDADKVALMAILERAHQNGVTDLRLLSPHETRELEPELDCDLALLSPSTGIVDSHGVMLSFQGDLEAAGGAIAFNTPLEAGEITQTGIVIHTGGSAPTSLTCRNFVNAGGLRSTHIARSIVGGPTPPTQYYGKGNYFELVGKSPFTHLIYPAPGKGHLGVHLTLDLTGKARFGPDIQWVEDDSDYEVDLSKAAEYETAVRRYWPGLPADSLTPAYTGIRPKIVPKGTPDADFRIDGPATHGVPGLVHCFGIESPGLTSSMALAEEVVRSLG
jgi:L-2-hydroxyglutarate oxidase LhgO